MRWKKNDELSKEKIGGVDNYKIEIEIAEQYKNDK